MIIPSIDLMNGNAVQLVGGKEKAIDAGDPLPIAENFRLAGEIAVIDLDAALGTGTNKDTISKLLHAARCRVGGGIRSVEAARDWLDMGAQSVILGTRAVPEILRELPRHRVMAALDAVDGEVVVDGWQTKTGERILERMQELREFVDGFLVTFVEKEGRLAGTNLELAKELVSAAGSAKVTIAGGVTTPKDIAALDEMGADAQVGMALYSGKLHLADAIAAPLKSDRPDKLWPTVITNEHGLALGLAWSSADSLRKAVETQRGVYQSRSRGLWIKGESSGATQELLAIAIDCDRDTLRFTVKQHGQGFCHLDTMTCWGDQAGIGGLEQTIRNRKDNAPESSYTARLFNDSELLSAKIAEEAAELNKASTKEEICWEAADLIYFTLVRMSQAGVTLADVEQELDRRARKVTRRPGNKKE